LDRSSVTLLVAALVALLSVLAVALWLLTVHGLLAVHGLLSINWLLLPVHGLLAVHRLLLTIHPLGLAITLLTVTLLTIALLLTVHRLLTVLPTSNLSLPLSSHIMFRLQQLFEGRKELWFLSDSVSILIDGAHGFHGLLVVDSRVVAGHGKDVVEELCEFVAVEASRMVGVVLDEDLVNVLLELLVGNAH
jgi:hypothetical protein